MRNLKRALSMAMASVMLMGMSVVGTSAASVSDFSDVDSINNQEAVAIATGLGIFDGYDDGSFKPEKVVTRAEMAVVIAKILHGADVNPANFAGAGKFTDVPAWAEGYVNLVAALGIIEGYGDGKFGPNDPVTTVQASTMLLKALGYYTSEGDALGADWALTVTSKANALGVYGDKALSMNEGLTREDVAELTFNALFAQRVAFDDVRGLHVKSNDRNVVVTNGTVDEMNTLAQNTFGLYAVEGVVVANGMTDETLAASLKSVEMTTVKFTEATDLNKDGKVEYAIGETYDFELESGLDMIGHAVKVYYKIEKKAPVVYAAVDQATKVGVITWDENDATLAKAANDLGFKKNTILNKGEAQATSKYIVNYDMDVVYDTLPAAQQFDLDTLIVISNSANHEVDYVIALDQYLDTVADVEVDGDEIAIQLTTDAQGNDMTIAMDDVKEDDYVIVTDIGNKGDVLVFEKAEVVAADITKITGKSSVGVGGGSVTKVTADGVDYTKSAVAPYMDNVIANALDNTKEFANIDVIGKANLIVDEFGKLIGLAEEKTLPNYAYVAQYGSKHVTSGLGTKEVLTALVYFADGTHGIYEVKDAEAYAATLPAANYTALVTDLNKSNGQDVDQDNDATGAIGLWDATVSGDKVTLKALAAMPGEVLTAGNEVIKGHSTLMNAGSAVTAYHGKALYQNNDTVYYYVNGTYDATKSNYGLTVKPVIGVKNAFGFTNNTPAGAGIKQAFCTPAPSAITGRNIVETMLIEGIVVGGSEDVYYYNRGNYEVVAAEAGKYTVTFYLNDVNGDPVSVTYDNQGHYWTKVSDAKGWAHSQPTGYYTIGATTLEVKFNTYNSKDADASDKITYVVGANASYDEYTDNLFDDVAPYGTITENTKVVDLTNNNMNSVSKIVSALKKGAAIDISYSYDDKTYETDVLYVATYAPADIAAPGGPVSTVYDFDNTLVAANASGVLTISTTTLSKNGTAGDVSLTSTGKMTVSVAMINGGAIVDLGTTNNIAATITAGVMSATIVPGFTLAAGNTYQVEVTFVDGTNTMNGVYFLSV